MGQCSQHARQDCLPVSCCPGCWPSCCPSCPWQHPWTCPWVSCCCCLVDCPDCPRWPACPPCWQEAVPLTPGNISGLVPGSEAARQWWTAQLLWTEQQAHHVGKRQATEWPAGVSAAICPNYPFCTIVPAGVSAAACPGSPYC